jgi:hypothetical protein
LSIFQVEKVGGLLARPAPVRVLIGRREIRT